MEVRRAAPRSRRSRSALPDRSLRPARAAGQAGTAARRDPDRGTPIPSRSAAMLGEAITLAVGAGRRAQISTASSRCRPRATGPIRLMVADVTARRGARLCPIRCDEARSARRRLQPGRARRCRGFCGGGLYRLYRRSGRAYRPLSGHRRAAGATLAECAQHYFRQSEQIEAGIKVAVGAAPRRRRRRWRAGRLMLQRVPPEGGYGVIAEMSRMAGAARWY